MSSSTKLRSSSTLPHLILSALNLCLFFISSASFAPIILLRFPPTSFGWALFIVSATTLLSSLLGFYSQLTHLCFITHISIILASSIGQALGFLSLFLRPDPSLRLLSSARSLREQKVLLKLEEGMILGMFMVQSAVLVSACIIQRWWVREYEGVEAEREVIARKRSRRMARVQEEAMANAAAMAEVKARALDEKMKNKYGQWMKNDIEG
ncbi:uncharacterized protein [Elaeis guineensis]|uniref:Uncharacterized protein LOC105036818 n=1 Tax=Elaeis guineensis var. tenera TaxID=51953 RepID=A0A6I9QN08_ELAGV|nr:uncharacterized protein LOC105036818 [Elaeis guineensis]